MSKGTSETEKRLPCRIHTRLTQEKYDELSAILEQSTGIRSHSELLRHILDHQQIVVQHYDATIDKILEKFSGIQKELQATGVNINQITRAIHQLDVPEDKATKIIEVLEHLLRNERKANELFEMMADLSGKWSPA
ncbi:hypothetical protein [Mucilaginibacter sp. dw_454]|uniref:plasmid mobilization protein n=1 Tax=Mucilaginibacter sp. dw_454 TaxID=2720079 RepID=UPI001BD2DEF6|nr:hypothetical protein [Mucilaginibacter sp. dw_454]